MQRKEDKDKILSKNSEQKNVLQRKRRIKRSERGRGEENVGIKFIQAVPISRKSRVLKAEIHALGVHLLPPFPNLLLSLSIILHLIVSQENKSYDTNVQLISFASSYESILSDA